MLSHNDNGKTKIWVSWPACLVQPSPSLTRLLEWLPASLLCTAHFPHGSWSHLQLLITLRTKAKPLTLAYETCHDTALPGFPSWFWTTLLLAHHCPALVFFQFLKHIELVSTLGPSHLFLLPGTVPPPHLCFPSSFLSFPFLIKCHSPPENPSLTTNLN